MSETEKPADNPASLEGIVRVTVHRKLTFKNGDDYNSIEGFIEFPESRTHALTALGESLNDLRQLLEEEKSETLTKTKQTPTLVKTPEPPSQQTSARTGDPYTQLPWNQSKNDTRYREAQTKHPASPSTLQPAQSSREAGSIHQRNHVPTLNHNKRQPIRTCRDRVPPTLGKLKPAQGRTH